MIERQLPRLMLVTDRRRCRGRPLAGVVCAAVAGGVGLVQLREKDLPERELQALATRLRGLLPATTHLVVNGPPEIARRCGCGLHLPESAALPPRLAGHRPSRKTICGRSCHDPEGAARAQADGLDYVVVGTIFASASKPDVDPAGIGLIREVRRQVGYLPIFAIGGVTADRVSQLLEVGVWGVAVCGAISSADDPRRAAEELTQALYESSGS